MYAVIKTGGKQYRVSTGDTLDVERLAGEPGETITFDEVLMVGTEDETVLGRPVLAGTSVKAEIVEQRRGKKLIIFKMKRRKNYRRKQGHRQELTRVRVTDILRSAGAVPPPIPE